MILLEILFFELILLILSFLFGMIVGIKQTLKKENKNEYEGRM